MLGTLGLSALMVLAPPPAATASHGFPSGRDRSDLGMALSAAGSLLLTTGLWLKEYAQVQAFVSGQYERHCSEAGGERCFPLRGAPSPLLGVGLMGLGLATAGAGGVIWGQSGFVRGSIDAHGSRMLPPSYQRTLRRRGAAGLGAGLGLMVGAAAMAIAPNPCFRRTEDAADLHAAANCGRLYAFAPALGLGAGAMLTSWGAASLAHAKGLAQPPVADLRVAPIAGAGRAGVSISGRF